MVGEEEPGLLRLLLRGKGDEGPRGVLVLHVARVAVPLIPSYPPLSLLLYLRDPDPSLPLV